MSEVDPLDQNSRASDDHPIESPLRAIEWHEAFELRRWWQRLTLSDSALKRYTQEPPLPRGVRAALRRCDSIESVLLTEAFRALWHRLETRAWQEEPEQQRDKRREERLETWATVTAVVAELRSEQFATPLGRRLGSRKKNSEAVRMSDLRFQQLLDCHAAAELIRRFRRALALADNEGVSVVYLADNVALWCREQNGFYRSKPTQRLAFILSNDYFGARTAKPDNN